MEQLILAHKLRLQGNTPEKLNLTQLSPGSSYWNSDLYYMDLATSYIPWDEWQAFWQIQTDEGVLFTHYQLSQLIYDFMFSEFYSKMQVSLDPTTPLSKDEYKLTFKSVHGVYVGVNFSMESVDENV